MPMRAVTFQAPGEVRVEERPEPRLQAGDDAVVAVDASGICGSDLHIYHARHPVEPGFTLGHEYVGRIVDVGDDVSDLAVGDRVVGCFLTACGHCFYCRRRLFHKCDEQRVFGHGAIAGDLPGAQAERVLVPHAALTLRRAPAELPDAVALFAGDVMGTGVHAVRAAALEPGETVAVLGLGPVGLCAVQAARAAGAAHVIAIDMVEERLEMARRFGAEPVHLGEQDPRAAARAATEAGGADVVVEAVGHPDALELAMRLARKAGRVSVVGVHAAGSPVHMGLVWTKGLTLTAGQANVIGLVDEVLDMLVDGVLDPAPLISDQLPLDDAAEGYRAYDRREALKLVLTP